MPSTEIKGMQQVFGTVQCNPEGAHRTCKYILNTLMQVFAQHRLTYTVLLPVKLQIGGLPCDFCNTAVMNLSYGKPLNFQWKVRKSFSKVGSKKWRSQDL